jgi:hypothetical protein
MRSAISRVKPRCGETGRSTGLESLDLGTSFWLDTCQVII